ncbi:hypothetical protein SAMN05428961_11748 [Paenibacillus sp. OK060]|nr:hypothetical protein SAMN05428961_11748 [Paenibacillus sp. OK060]SLK20794.1 hypothetical protein SAMN06272722_1175 [Paenibacillus sp. RU5A]SOC76290.1 hypothetical protein SAMN05880581_1175 [Paenibacillus sp. RU26A]SOC77974.1 hypothetical protein SAMN05880586_11776 [Paenibacillus sp. RU5M]
MSVKRGQKKVLYEIRIEGICLHVNEGWTYGRIMEKYGTSKRHWLKV